MENTHFHGSCDLYSHDSVPQFTFDEHPLPIGAFTYYQDKFQHISPEIIQMLGYESDQVQDVMSLLSQFTNENAQQKLEQNKVRCYYKTVNHRDCRFTLIVYHLNQFTNLGLITTPYTDGETACSEDSADVNKRETILFFCYPDGSVADVNPLGEHVFGYSRNEFCTFQIESIAHPNCRKSFSRCFSTGTYIPIKQSNVLMITKSGNLIYVNLTMTPIYVNHELLGFHFTAHLAIEEWKIIRALQKNEATLAIAQDFTNTGFWDWNASTDELYWSDGVFNILGIPVCKEDLTTNRLGSFIHPSERERVNNLIYDTLHSQSSYETEYRIICPRGNRMVREHANVIKDESGQLRMIGVIQDITNSAVFEKEQVRLMSLVQASPNFIATISARGRLLYVNPAGRKLLGIRNDENISTTSAFQFLGSRDTRKCKCLAAILLMDKKPWSGECAFTNRSGSMIPVHLTVIGHRNQQGLMENFSVIACDISEKKRLENKVQHQAYYDALTGLPNRTLLMNELKHMTEPTHPTTFRAAIVFIDLDDFKQINDSLGHTIGDQILIKIAKRLKTCVGEADIVARWGGDEFVLILQNIESPARVTLIIRKIVQLIEESIYIHSEEFRISPSIGISLYPNDGFDSETLVKNADLAMYYAKRQTGKNYEFYTPSMSEDEFERMTIRHELQKALMRNELEVYYQPLIDTKTLNLVGAEALIRWHHPAKGLISPVRFIPIAEESGLITDIDSFVIQNVCTQLQKWNATSVQPLRIAVNISAKQFDDDNFIYVLERAVHSIKPELLELEITESAIMKNERETIDKLKRIRSIGIRLSLDDFGTGYSSLNYLRLFSTDTIKIDQAFVNEITTKPEVTAITKSLISLAHALSMKVVAEGVETAEQLQLLREFDCDIVQGYLFSRPLPLNQFESQFLTRSRH